MRSYRRLSLLAAGLLAAVFVVGLAGSLTPRGEVFPLASWFLFVLVPNHTTEYDMEFRAANDQALPQPLRFARSSGLTIQPHSITGFQVVQQLGRALEHGDAEKTRTLRRQIDSLCYPGRFRYDVVKVVYDPVARYDTDATQGRRVLGTFTTREP